MPKDMFYVYGDKDPHCSCCKWEYAFDEFEDEEKAKIYAKKLDDDGYCVTLIKGIELSFK